MRMPLIRSAVFGTLLGALFLAAPAYGFPYDEVIVFGDSLSDSGNNAIFFGPANRTPVPPASPADLVPTFPYASDRYTNGPVWVEHLAARLGASATPALAGGTNFASGAARSGPLGSVFPFSVRDQVRSFLTLSGNTAPSDALFIVQGGGNDARDIATGLVSPAIGVPAFAGNMATAVGELQAAGARNIIVVNVPDIGKTPAALAGGPTAAAQASELASLMNDSLDMALDGLAGPGNVQIFDLFALVGEVFADPAAFGFADTTSMCVVTPTCLADPSKFFFWDAIHPTAAGHLLLAEQAMVLAVPEPEVYAMLIAGLALLGLMKRGQTPFQRPLKWGLSPFQGRWRARSSAMVLMPRWS
jgi:phospholipase/lecithinase/hemolysin